MSALKDILSKTNFTETIQGVDFILRPVSAERSLNIIGKKSLGIIRGAGSGKELSEEDNLSLVADLMPKYLKVCMVSPKLGDVTDPDNDTISLEDLGHFAMPVFAAVFNKSGYGQIGNFPASSEVTQAEK